MLLGADLVAPMGVEWEAAGAANVTRFAYRRSDRMASPAAASFVRSSGVTWQNYATPGEFVAHFELALIRELVNGTPGYGLDLKAIEELAERLQEREAHGHGPRDREASGGSQEAQEWHEDETRRGAGHGGVILPSA